MNKFLILGIVLFCTLYVIAPVAYTQEEDANIVVSQLSSELEKAGTVAAGDLKQITNPLKEMINKGATKEELKRTLKDLSAKGISGKDLKDAVSSMNDLVKNDVAAKEAGNVVSKAVKEAQAQGLKGKDLAAKVHEAVKQRKQQMKQQKQQMQQQKQQLKQQVQETKGTAKQKGK